MRMRAVVAVIVAGWLIGGGIGMAGTTLRLAHEDPTDSPRHKAATLFAEKVKEYTQGRYTVDVHHSATLGSGDKLLEQLKLGAVDLVNTGTAIFSNHVPELTLLTLPYLVESYEQGWALYDTSPWVKEHMDKLRAKNIRVLAMWEAGFRHLTTKKPVQKPDDVKGMKVRVAKNQVYLWLWSALGANPTVIPFGETYISLQQGVVDAQETPINTIQANKFYEVTKYINLTNHIYGPQPLGMTDRRWQSLAPPDQAAIQKAALDASSFHRKAVVSEDDERLTEMKAKGAIVVQPDVPAFGKASLPVYDKAGQNFPKAVLQALIKDADAVKATYPVK